MVDYVTMLHFINNMYTFLNKGILYEKKKTLVDVINKIRGHPGTYSNPSCI